MKKQAIIIFSMIIIISSSLFGDCKVLSKQYEAKLSQFNDVKNKMSKPDISKEQYNDLYKQYTALWAEASQIKKKIQICEQGAKSKHIALFNEGI
ncbi:MAG: hypothetical protein KAH33_07660, partial [Candidatus Delongbacteria bacterium]|nr:hypothetical protein [Candidatus Delongbacteria bacterium]